MTRWTPSRLARGVGAAALLLAAVLGVAPYLATLGYDPMALDSVYWIVRSAVAHDGWAAWTFGGPHFIAYRPVAALSFTLTGVFAGLDPAAYRAFDVALHAANGALVYAVGRRLAPDAGRWVAALAAVLFLGHPAAEEVVPWLARRHNALACGFSLLAIHALLGALAKPPRRTAGLGAAAWLAAALLSNEVAFTTAAMLPFLAFAVRPEAGARASLRLATPALATAVAVLVLRSIRIGGLGGYTPTGAGPLRIARVFLAFWRDLLLFDLEGTLRLVAVVALPLATATLVAAALRSQRHRRLLALMLGWLLGASVLLALQQVWFPRELYGLLPAFALLLAFGLDAVLAAWPSAAPRAVALALVAAYLGPLASVGWQAQPRRLASWREMQRQLDELEAGLESVAGPGEILLAIRYPEPMRPHGALRARSARPGPPRSTRIPAVWLSARHADRGITVRDAVAFPASPEGAVRFERIDGRPTLLFPAQRPFFAVGAAERVERDGRVGLRLDSLLPRRTLPRWVFLRDAAPGSLIPLASGAAGASPPPDAAAPATPTNVLLIVVDTLRRDHLGVYGYARDTSPHIDRLAAEGVRYQRALAAAPWTTPSVASLLTSRQPAALGIRDLDSRLGEEAVLLSERLRQRGWRTGAVVSHRFVSRRWGFDQGFDSFDDENALDHEAVTSAAVSDRALAFLQEGGNEPFFLFLHYFDPHFAYREHEGFRFPAEAPYSGPARPGVRFGELLKQQDSLREADAAELMRRYDSEIRFTDHQIGRVLDFLRERGLLEDTLVVLTADHGEEFLDHGRLGHTKTLYDEVVGVPLIVRRPGIAPGVVEEPVALLDVVPTVLSAAGLPLPPELEGAPLRAPAPESQAAPRDAPPPERFLFTATDRRQPKRAAVGGGRKRIHDLRTGTYEEYDLRTDPAERRPVDEGDPRLAAALEAFEQRLAEEGGEAPVLELSPEERERLRLLGYGDDG